MFAPIDTRDLHVGTKLRTLPALWNVRAMVALDVPWWTWDAIVEVEDFLAARPSARAFEWGSGASTCWLARRSASVVSVEHHVSFAASLRPSLAAFANVELLERRGGYDGYGAASTHVRLAMQAAHEQRAPTHHLR